MIIPFCFSYMVTRCGFCTALSSYGDAGLEFFCHLISTIMACLVSIKFGNNGNAYSISHFILCFTVFVCLYADACNENNAETVPCLLMDGFVLIIVLIQFFR